MRNVKIFMSFSILQDASELIIDLGPGRLGPYTAHSLSMLDQVLFLHVHAWMAERVPWNG